MSKVILITGSNTGIGLELARILAQKKHIVYISSRKESSGKEALNTLHSEGLTNAKFVLLDVTKPATIQAAVSAISAAEGRLDILVNNAAISNLSANQSAPSISIETMREVMETNVYGVIQTTTAFLPLLKKSESPEILNVSSGLGSNVYQSKQDNYHYVAYNSSKAALNSYTIALAHELKGEGMKVNAVTPALTSTQLNGFAEGQSIREGAEDLLAAVLFDKDGSTAVLFDKDGSTGKFYGPKGMEFPW